jgi:hypothetical protein
MDRDIKGIIKDENPINHWGFLDVKDRIVLDLGCGINSEFLPTPYYFIVERGAKKVIGVDSNEQSYQWFKQNFNVQNFIPFKDMVDRYEKFEFYFDYFKPDVVKMDVEGSEIYMNAFNNKLFDSVEEIAIEYHSYPCLIAIEGKLRENNYKLEYYKFEHLDLEHQGVLFAYKTKFHTHFENQEFKRC